MMNKPRRPAAPGVTAATDLSQTLGRVTVQHPNGGVSEVTVMLFANELSVNVNTSKTNPWSVAINDVDVATSND